MQNINLNESLLRHYLSKPSDPLFSQAQNPTSRWKIDRGRDSERRMLSARNRLREPVSNSRAILDMKAYHRATRKPKGAI